MTLIPANRLVTWTPGTHTGVYGGIPTTRTMYVNALTGALGGGGSYGGTLAAGDGVTDDTAAINAMIALCPADQYVYLPAATYLCLGTINIGVSGSDDNISLKGDGMTTIIDSRSDVMGIQIGGGNGFVLPAGAVLADMVVSAGLAKNSTTLTIGSAATLSVGQLVRLIVENDSSVPVLSTFDYQDLIQQTVEIVSKTSTTITFRPPLYSDYGSGTLDAHLIAPAVQTDGVGIEDMLIDLTESSGAYGGFRFNQCLNCWAKGVRVDEAGNYPFSIVDSLFTEVRRCYAAPNRNGLNPSGAGILHNSCSGSLVEDNEIVSNFPGMEVNAGSAGNFFSRNFFFGSYINTNHGPWNQYNLYEGNVADGVLADGYFGGAGPDVIYNNKIGYLALKRMTRDYQVVGNMINRAPSDFLTKAGDPNISNDGSTGECTFPSDPWADYAMTGTLTSTQAGTGTGYLINNPGGYTSGTTSLTLDTGSGTILVGNVISITVDSTPRRYSVVTALTGGVVVIAGSGLVVAVPDNAAVTVQSDFCTVTLGTGFTATGYNGFEYQYLRLWWNSYASSEQFRVLSFNAGTRVATLLPNSTTANEVNATALPALSTFFNIGAGYTGWQEQDQVVRSSTSLKGNRYSDASFDSLGGDTLPNSLAYSADPAWLIAARVEYPSATFNLKPYDPVTPASAGDSDIPAGYRYTFLTPPEHSSASINSLGTELSIGLNKPVTVGAGGSASATLSGGVVCPFARLEGSAIIFTTPRTITDGESLTVALTNAANGYEDANGNDLPSFSGYAVVNSSSSTTGVVHYGPDEVDMTMDSAYNDSGTTLLQPCTVLVNGTAIAVRFYIAGNLLDPSVRVTVCDASANVLGSGTGTVAGTDRWQSVAVTSFPVTENTVYMSTVQFLANGDPTLRSLPAQGANSSYFHETTPYGTALPAQFSPITGSTSKFAVQLRVAPDDEPASAVVNGVMTVGTLVDP